MMNKGEDIDQVLSRIMAKTFQDAGDMTGLIGSLREDE